MNLKKDLINKMKLQNSAFNLNMTSAKQEHIRRFFEYRGSIWINQNLKNY